MDICSIINHKDKHIGRRIKKWDYYLNFKTNVMKRSKLFVLLLICISQLSFGQNQKFKMEGINSQKITVDQSFTKSTEIFPFDKDVNKIYGLDASANIELNGGKSSVRLILIDNNFNEYLIYESYNLLLEEEASFSIENICEETSILGHVKPYSIQIEIENAQLELKSLSYSTAMEQGKNIATIKKEKKKAQNDEKINKINQNLKKKGKHWVAGSTSVSELSYAERKKLYGQSTFPAGFEYYAGGVISASSTKSTSTEGSTLKSATTPSSPYVDEWDWKDRHGKNWITPVTDQGLCGSCWSFATTGATEAMTNLFYNQLLNLDLSEQDLVSCSGAGDCTSGLPSSALDYIQNTGIIDEVTFPYSASDQPCADKGNNPQETIKISGRVDFGAAAYPKTEDVLKDLLIKRGPLSGGLRDWAHAMVLVGYKVVKEGDLFYYRDLNWSRYWKTVEAGDPLIGTTVWIFKNSWGSLFGDAGYVYVETSMTNFDWTHAIKTPITSTIKNYNIICEDKDGDGYYWWGLGPKPATCTGPDTPDGNDADPTLGPLDDFGHCTIIGGQPVANFTSSSVSVVEGESIQFTDLSENALSRVWTFEGGNPASSTLSSPSVQYNISGIHNVSLTVYNNDKSDTKTITGYIVVEECTPHYCESNGNASYEWIEAVQFGLQIYISGSSGATGYQDLTDDYTFTVDPGSRVVFTLTPNFSVTERVETWKIWIDYNGDKDFDDSGELIYYSPLSPSVLSNATTIPSNLNITTRMRVSMKRSSGASQCEIFASGEVEDYMIQIGSLTNSFPVANFTANKTTVNKTESVTFLDLSTNIPTSWNWVFEGGNPATSSAQNPSVTYNIVGSYKVTLTATNASGTDTKIIENYIQVEEITATYCYSSGNATNEWISSVQMGENLYESGSGGYEDFTSVVFNFEAGKTHPITLMPGFSSRNKFEYWSVWIDFNGDMDFTDAGEQVFTSSKNRASVSGTVTIPDGISIDTRMRVAMGQSAPADCGFIEFGEVEDYSVHIAENTPGDYCEPLAVNSSFDYIQNVVIGNILNNSTIGNNYSLYPDIVSIMPGQEYNVSMTPSSLKTRNFWRIWIDFNGDGDFDDSDETVVVVNNKKRSISSSFVIPAYATGTTRMRIAMKVGKVPTPCGGNFDGEVEDYLLSFEPAASQQKSIFTDNQDIEISQGFKIYPNPVNQILNIQLNSTEPGDFYAIYNLNGEKLVSNQITSTLTTVELTNYSPGIYFIVAVNKGEVFNEKFVKK